MQAFGEAVFDIIAQEPGRLREVTGIGPNRADRIIAGWAKQKVIREIILFLQSNGVGTSLAVRIYKSCAADAIRKTRTGRPSDIRGIGFRTGDRAMLLLLPVWSARSLVVKPRWASSRKPSDQRSNAGVLATADQALMLLVRSARSLTS